MIYGPQLESCTKTIEMLHTKIQLFSRRALFSVFDGHGTSGTECSQFARERVPINFVKVVLTISLYFAKLLNKEK
jgi:serine/threonine protein phosphatase PrpC